MNTFDLQLDLDKSSAIQVVTLRQGNIDGTTIVDGFRLIATTTDSYKVNTSYAGTVNELAFDVMTFDFESGVVNCVRIGRGDDRTLTL